MKILLTQIFFSLCCISVYAQSVTFERVHHFSEDFVGIDNGTIAFGDIDGDSDLDVLISGSPGVTELYKNNGSGLYTLVPNTGIDPVSFCDAAFADVDGDGDFDLLVSGYYYNYSRSTKLYLNNGNGDFTVDTNSEFEQVSHSSLVFGDIDGDSDLDVVVAGYNEDINRTCNLYLNNGEGEFTLSENQIFSGTSMGNMTFGDIDGDNDLDFIITGQSVENTLITECYRNDGLGNFTLDENNEIQGYGYYNALELSDLDGDGDKDLFLSGSSGNGGSTEIFLNDGTGLFSAAVEIGIPHYGDAGAAIADFDGDLDMDIIVAGENGQYNPSTDLYLNDGTGSFQLASENPFEQVESAALGIADIENDGDLDVMIAGEAESWVNYTNLYQNDGSGSFSSAQGNQFQDIRRSEISFGDVDGDGDQDVFISGRNNTWDFLSQLYLNSGSGSYSLSETNEFTGVSNGAIAFADIDGDLDLDLFLSGFDGYISISQMFENDGNGAYTLIEDTPFTGVKNGDVQFADVDLDDDLDLIITGENEVSTGVTELYLNDGNGHFNLQEDTPFAMVRFSAIGFSDIDGDLDPDLMITGLNSDNDLTSLLYLNDGNGNYEESTNSFQPVFEGSLSFLDIDSDGDNDLLLMGRSTEPEVIAHIYENDGDGEFNLSNANPLEALYDGSIDYADIDEDGDLDLIITGNDGTNDYVGMRTLLYQNDGIGNFILMEGILFKDVQESSVAFSDVDNDDDPDLLITGWTGLAASTELWRNVDCAPASIIVDQNDINLSAPEDVFSYQWVDCDDDFNPIIDETSQIFSANENGNYAVQVNVRGCLYFSDCVPIISVGTEHHDYNQSLLIYPTPNSGQFTLELEQTTNKVRFRIINLTGQIVESRVLQNVSSVPVNVDLPAGVYVVQIQSGDKISQTKIVIE